MLAEAEGVSIWNLKATRAFDKKGTMVSLSLVFSSYDQSGLKSDYRGPRFSPNLGVEKWLVGYNRKHFLATSKFLQHVVTNNSMNLEVWKGVRQSQSYYVPVYKVGLENNSIKAKGSSKFLCSNDYGIKDHQRSTSCNCYANGRQKKAGYRSQPAS